MKADFSIQKIIWLKIFIDFLKIHGHSHFLANKKSEKSFKVEQTVYPKDYSQF